MAATAERDEKVCHCVFKSLAIGELVISKNLIVIKMSGGRLFAAEITIGAKWLH